MVIRQRNGGWGPWVGSRAGDGAWDGGGGEPIGTGSEAQTSMSPLMSGTTFPPQKEYWFKGYCQMMLACIAVSSIVRIAPRLNGGGGAGLVAPQPPGRAKQRSLPLSKTDSRVIWLPFASSSNG